VNDMWKSKKFIIAAVLAIAIALASFGGIALAADDGEDVEAEAPVETIWDNMAAVLQEDGVDVTAEQLESAFTTVQENLRSSAMQNFLDKMVADDIITQEQADAYKGWIEAKPDMGEEFGFGNHGGTIRNRIRMHGSGGMRGPGGMRGLGGSGGFCLPTE
ncbi:hypothetical protein ACFLYN_05915, partial [Chloroflexota bacterium]